MITPFLFNLITLVHLLCLTIVNRISGVHYPTVNFDKSGYVFDQTKRTVSNIVFNLVKESSLYQKVLKGRFTKRLLIVSVSVRYNNLHISLYRPVKREMQSGLRSVVGNMEEPQDRFEFVMKDGILIRPVSNTPNSWVRQIGYYPEDPILSFKLPMSSRTQRELLDHVYTDRFIQDDFRTEIVPESHHKVERMYVNDDMIHCVSTPSRIFPQ